MVRPGGTVHLRVLDDARLFEEVGRNAGRANATRRVELDLDPLAKARRVGVSHGLGVAEGLEQGVRLQDALLDKVGRATRPAGTPGGATPSDDVAQAVLGGLGLACTRLARDEDGLLLLLHKHTPKCRLGQDPDVRGHVVQLLGATASNALLLWVLWVQLGRSTDPDQ